MTTATTPRPQAPATKSPIPPPPAPTAHGVTPVDPIKLLKQHAPLLILCVMLGSAIGLGSHFAILRTWPIFRAGVLYECAPPIKTLTKEDNTVYSQEEHDRYMGTQTALMTSDLVFQATAKDPEVQRTRWAKRYVNSKGEYQPKDAALALDNRLTARVQPMTNLIRLTCSWKYADDAATIVNAANRAYLEDAKNYARRMDNDRREVLARRLKDIRDSIDSLVSQRERLIAEKGLTSETTQGSNLFAEIQSLQAERAVVAGRVASLKKLVDNYQGKISQLGRIEFPDRVIEAAAADPTVREMERELSDLKSREQALLMQGIGENHPDIKAVRTLIESKQHQHDSTLEDTKQKLFAGDMDNTSNNLAASEANKLDLDKRIEDLKLRLQDFLTSMLRSTQIKDQIERLQTDQSDTEGAIKQLDSIGLLKEASRIRVLRQGQTPDDVAFPKIYILIPAGAVLVPLLVAGVIFLREIFDQRVRGPADLSLIPRLRVLGVIPDAAEDPSHPAIVATAFRDSPSSAVTESFRQLRAPLVKKLEQSGHRSLLVIPGMPGSGGTSVVTNLGIGAAVSERKVLIIDANYRRPGVHKVFGLAEGPGLGDVLVGASDLAGTVQATSVENLSVLTAGTVANRALPERLATETMARLIREACERFDLVLIDAPPAIVSGDGLALANRVDATVLVARAMAEKRGLVARLQAQLADSRSEFLGVILNGARSSAGGYFKRNIRATHEYQNHKAD